MNVPQYGEGHKRPMYPQKANNAPLGLLIGILFPLLGVLLLYFFWSGNNSFGSYLKMFIQFNYPSMMNMASKVLSLSMISNLIPFYYFLNRKKYQTVRGLLISMVLYLVLIVLYKFVWQ